jgi:uncharacterized protein
MRQEPAVGKKNYKAFTPELRSIDDRTIEFVASTEAVDRYGDIIRVSGWKLDNYLRNPVFLWGHKSGEPPIGKTVGIHVETSPVPALVQRVEFADKETYPFADTIFNLYKGKFLRAVSVGFLPLEHPKAIRDENNDRVTGWEFTSQELLELSAVPVPANSDALARCVKKGFAEADLQRVFVPQMSEADALRELAAIYQEISRIAVGLAAETVREALAALKAARPEAGDLTLEELLAAIREAGTSLPKTENSGEITSINTLDDLAAAVGNGDSEVSLEQTFSDSRSLRTGKFKFALHPELR